MLDEYARAALTMVPPDVLGGQDEAWFQFLLDNVGDETGNPRSWDEFARAVRESPEGGSFGQAVEILTEELERDASGWPAIADQLVQETAPDLVTAYHEALEEAAAASDGAESGDLWSDLVAEGGDWSNWDGSDDGWEQWRDWFYEVATGRGEAADSMAREQLGSLDEVSLAERIAGLESLGFTISDAARAAAEGAAEQDPGEAFAALVSEAGDWSDWDGSDDGYAQWRDYFYGVAASHGEADEMLARERLDPLDGATLADRIAGLQEQGFTVAGAQEALEGQQQEAQETVDALVNDHIEAIIDDALSAVSIDPAMFGDLKPLLQNRLESVAQSQPELFVGEELDKLRDQLQGELQQELQTAAAAVGASS